MRKRSLSVLLALAMSLTMIPRTVCAAEPGASPVLEEAEVERSETEESAEPAETEEAVETEELAETEEAVETLEHAEPEEPLETAAPEAQEEFTSHTTGYRPLTDPVEIEDVSVLPVGVVPRLRASRYDSRYITAPLPDLRSQGDYGACWSFASMAAAETNLLKQGIVDQTDLSEAHLVYYSYNQVQDPLGGLNGDRNAVSGSNIFDEGGNTFLSQNVLSAWTGAADEASYPYDRAATYMREGISPGSRAFDDVAHLKNYYETTFNSVNNYPLKELILRCGAVCVSFCAEDAYRGGVSTGVYNIETNAYYNPVKCESNHAVSIVGWDDGFSRDSFTIVPPGDGAWLVRNSWTTGNYETGQTYNGYFWMSYYEPSLDGIANAFEFERADNYDNNYQYDGAMQNVDVYADKYANVFTAHAEGGQNGETLRAASFYTPSSNVSYKIEVYTGLTSASDPTSGTLRSTTYGVTDYPGYYTVPLSDIVPMSRGTQFSVVVTLEKAGYEPKLGCENRVTSWYYSLPSALAGQSFTFSNGAWSDFGLANNRNLRIKAFTTNDTADDTILPADIAFPEDITDTGLTMSVGDTYMANATVMPLNAADKRITWESSAPSVATVNNGLVTGVSAGNATITARSVSGNAVGSFDVIITPVTLRAITMYGEVSLSKGKTYEYTLSPVPENAAIGDVTWNVSDPSKLSIDSHGVVTPLSVGPATITAETGGFSASQTVKIYPWEPVLSVEVRGDNTVDIIWDAVPDAEIYEVVDGESFDTIDTIQPDGSSTYRYTDTRYSGKQIQKEIEYVVYVGENDYWSYDYIEAELDYFNTIAYVVGRGTNNPDNPNAYKTITDHSVNIPLLDPIPPIGYEFAGWYTDAGFDESKRITAITWENSGNLKIYARYERTPGWQRSGRKTYYVDNEWNRVTGWQTIDGETYYFDPSSGYMKTGWITLEGDTYYLAKEDGHMLKGECTIEGDTYFFAADSGVMQTGWINDKYYDEDGKRQTGWVIIGDEEYYLDPETGIKQTSVFIEDEDGQTYYLDGEGQRVTGWSLISGHRYFFDEDGIVVTGWADIDGDTYYFDESGSAVSDLAVIDKKLYYFIAEEGEDKNKLVCNEEMIINTVEFTADDDGVLSSSEAHWLTLADGQYYIDRSGKAVTGWIEKDGYKHYLDPKTGAMAIGAKRIGFKIYYFEDDGRLASGGTTPALPTSDGSPDKTYDIREDGSLKTGWTRGGGYIPAPALNRALSAGTPEILSAEGAAPIQSTADTQEQPGTASAITLQTASGTDGIFVPEAADATTAASEVVVDVSTVSVESETSAAESDPVTNEVDDTKAITMDNDSSKDGVYHSNAVISDAGDIEKTGSGYEEYAVIILIVISAGAVIMLAVLGRRRYKK